MNVFSCLQFCVFMIMLVVTVPAAPSCLMADAYQGGAFLFRIIYL